MNQSDFKTLNELTMITRSSDFMRKYSKEERDEILIRKVKMIRERIQTIFSNLSESKIK